MPHRPFPAGVTGDPSLIKVSIGMLGPGRYRCPARDALDARPGLRPSAEVHDKAEALQNFPSGPFMRVLDLMEGNGRTRDAAFDAVLSCASVHDSVKNWTIHAVTQYLAEFPVRSGDTVPYQGRAWRLKHELRVPDARGADEYRIGAWGRRYHSMDGRLRELRLPVHRAGGRVRTDAEISVAACVLAAGEPGPLPERVRIRQFGMADGVSALLFDGSRDSALALYERAGKAELAALVDRSHPLEYRPGSSCRDCSFAVVCPALQKSPGLLGVRDRSRPRRAWSATSARNYEQCPAREYARRQRLPADQHVERSDSAERGRAIHRYLEVKHADSLVSCTPSVPKDWVPDEFVLTCEEQELGALLLRNHAAVCPAPQATSMRVEPDLVYEDPDADTVVLAKPDLLYHDGETWVWRETKTSRGRFSRSLSWFGRYPQLALAVALADTVPELGIERIELEILRPAGADLLTFDPRNSEVRQLARETVVKLFAPWHADDQFVAVPGPHCRRCEVARWCSARSTGVEAAS